MTSNTPGRPAGTTARNTDVDDRHADTRPGSSAAEVHTAHDDHTTQNAMLGTARSRATSNVSWGSIIAGVVTFLALTVLFSMVSAAMGLDGASGTATGIWTVVALAIALAVAGYVAGALAARGGLLHGFLTWAASLLSVLVLAGWLGTTMLGAVGNVVGSVANQANISAEQVQGSAEQAQDQVTQQDVDQARQQAGQAADTTAQGLWWAFAGTLIGAGIAAATGAAGARSVAHKREEVTYRA